MFIKRNATSVAIGTYTDEQLSKMYLRFQGGGPVRCPSCLSPVNCDEEHPDDACEKTRYFAFVCTRCELQGQFWLSA